MAIQFLAKEPGVAIVDSATTASQNMRRGRKGKRVKNEEGEEVQWVRNKNTRRGRKGRRVKNEGRG